MYSCRSLDLDLPVAICHFIVVKKIQRFIMDKTTAVPESLRYQKRSKDQGHQRMQDRVQQLQTNLSARSDDYKAMQLQLKELDIILQYLKSSDPTHNG